MGRPKPLKLPLPTKIGAPRLSACHMRTRLFQILDRARKRPVVWVTGPAGAGKTTLAASYVQRRRLACLWYQMDEGDADIAAFFYYLGLAAKGVAPKKSKDLPLFTPEYQLGLRAFSLRYFERFWGCLRRPTLLVFDNYHTVPEDAMLHEVVCDALSRLPEGSRAVMISRHAPPPAFARLRAADQIALIDNDDLRLTLDETAGIAQRHAAKKLPEPAVRELHRHTQGWAAGVVLMSEFARIPGRAPRAGDMPASDEIFAYFANELFKAADEPLQHFLLKTAFLPHIVPETADRLAGRDDGGALLSQLHRKNYFTVRHQTPKPIYRYHPLFREFLIAHAEQAFPAAELANVQRTAAALLAEENQIEEAAALCIRIGEWKQLTQLIHRHASALLAQGRNRTLQEWLQAFPQAERTNNPWLLYYQGMSRLALNPRASRPYFEYAFGLFNAANDAPGAYLAWAAVVYSFVYEWGNCTALDDWIARYEELKKQHPNIPSIEIEGHVAHAMFCALMYRRPDRARIQPWEDRVRALMDAGTDKDQRMSIGYFLVLYYIWWIGDLPKAGVMLEGLRPEARAPQVTPLTRIRWHLLEAIYAWFTISYDACSEAIGRGLEIARATGVHLLDFIFLTQGAYNALTAGKLKEAENFLQQMAAKLVDARPVDVAQYHYLKSCEALLRDDLPRALEYARIALDMATKLGLPFAQVIVYVALAQARFEQGDVQQALADLDAARRIGRAMESANTEFWCALCEAHFALARNDPAAALAPLRKAVTLAKHLGYVNCPLWRPSIMTRLCIQALEHDIETDYVRQLIRKRRLNLENPPVHLEHWPWAVKVYACGRLSLEIDGKPVALTRRGGIGKPLALLKALIALGGQAVNQATLTEALWPEAEGDSARCAFDTTLHRLRKLLPADALVLEDGKLSLDARHCWVDVWALEHLLAQWERQRKAPLTPEQAPALFALVERIFALYPGPFLKHDSDTAWSLLPREHLQARLLGVVRELGRLCEQANLFDQAIAYYHKGLHLDPLLEDLYQRLMRAYQALGRHAEALATYRRCKETLAKVLKLSPSPATEALYKALQTPQSPPA